MTDERTRRIGHNEALYRQVNERIEDLNEAFSMITDDFGIVCECGDLACAEQLTVSRDVYEQTRANSFRFIVKPGHQADGTERIVERGGDGGYIIVEKEPPDARRIAAETDPRT